MTPTVYINGKFLDQTLTGVQRYARETLLAMDALIAEGELTPEFDLKLLAPAGVPAPSLRAIEFRNVGTLHGHAWEQLELFRASRDGWLWSFGATGPLLKRRQVVTIHDAAVRAVPDAYDIRFRMLYELMLPVLARRTALVMTVSRFSHGEVVRCFGADPARTHVSGEGWQHALRVESDRSVLAAHGLQPQSYVFAVSSVAPHKNFAAIARAMRRLEQSGRPLSLVIAGENTQGHFGNVDMSALRSANFLGHVSDGQLRALYENAALFVFPSLYEGFGLPPLEAMALGCPVVASSAAAIPEVCGDAAVYFDPRDERALADTMTRLLADSDARAELRARGYARLQHHSWTNCAREHLSAMASATTPPSRYATAYSSSTQRGDASGAALKSAEENR
jgi:glycosyltransferase involved in cell wall biosynthesis